MSEKEKQAAKEVIDSLKQIPPGRRGFCPRLFAGQTGRHQGRKEGG